MTRDEFLRLIKCGHVTNVSIISKYLNDEKALAEVSIEDIFNMQGHRHTTIKAACSEAPVVDVTEAPVEDVTEAPVEDVTEAPVKKETSKKKTSQTVVDVTEAPAVEVVDDGRDG